MNCILLILLFFVTTTLGSDVKIITPNSTTVWQAGNRQHIQWNVGYAETGKKYYSNFTRVSIALFDSSNNREMARVIDNFPYMLGSIYWKVPVEVTVDGWFGKKRNVTLGNIKSKSYYIMIYPSYFDWSNACPGCKSRAPKGQKFMILPNDCSSPECQALLPKVDRSGESIPGEGSKKEYLLAVQFVGIGVGTVALIGFVVAFFVYTKQGRKTWQKYRRKRSGLLYRYKPPVTEHKSPSPKLKAKTESPLGNFFSETEEGNPRFSKHSLNDSLFISDKRDGFKAAEEYEKDSVAVDLAEPSPAVTKTSPKIHQSLPTTSGIEQNSNRNSYISGTDTITISSRPISTVNSIGKNVIDLGQAAIVGNAFRTALRVQPGDDEDTDIIEIADSDQLAASYERDHEKFMRTIPEHVQEECNAKSCSPLLSHLSFLEEQNR